MQKPRFRAEGVYTIRREGENEDRKAPVSQGKDPKKSPPEKEPRKSDGLLHFDTLPRFPICAEYGALPLDFSPVAW